MGKGDRRTKKGKRWRGSFGNSRRHKPLVAKSGGHTVAAKQQSEVAVSETPTAKEVAPIKKTASIKVVTKAAPKSSKAKETVKKTTRKKATKATAKTTTKKKSTAAKKTAAKKPAAKK